MQHRNPNRASHKRAMLCGFLACIGSAGVLWAQSAKGPITVQLTAYKVVAKGEKDELEAADKIKPGETIEYQARYANTSKQSVKNLAATMPIPAGMEFVNGSALPDGAQASTDGKNFASLPLRRVTKGAGGTTKIEMVPMSEYRSLRWSIGQLDAGKSITVFARARVLGPVKSTSKTGNTYGRKGGGPLKLRLFRSAAARF